jgi:hypothetical protein
LMRKSGHENRVLRTSNEGFSRNCSTFPATRHLWLVQSAHSSAQRPGSNLYAHLMLIGSIRRPLPHEHVRKAGAVLKIDLGTHQAVEVVGEISDRDVSRGTAWWPEIRRGSDASGRGIMPRTDISAEDHERYGRARARGDARVADPSSVVNARCVSGADAIELVFKGGGSMSIPSAIVPGLERSSASKLEPVVVSPAGDALSWPSLDVDVSVPGLVERAFGTRLFAASTGRRGGRRRSKAKAAAKANGARGGRPRKRLSA